MKFTGNILLTIAMLFAAMVPSNCGTKMGRLGPDRRLGGK